MQSMTGFASKEVESGNFNIYLELKSVNSRFLDISIAAPPYLNPFLAEYRTIIKEHITRGAIECLIKINKTALTPSIKVNEGLALSYLDAIFSLKNLLSQHLKDKVEEESVTKIDAKTLLPLILSQEGVLDSSTEIDSTFLNSLVTPLLKTTLTFLVAQRKREGDYLQKVLKTYASSLQGITDSITSFIPSMEEKFRTLLETQFNSLYSEANYKMDETKLLSEVSSMIVKYSINEEVTRLNSHIEAMQNLLEAATPCGKTLDFLCQEVMREFNTIGSKSQEATLSSLVIKAKGIIEDIRQQARNVE